MTTEGFYYTAAWFSLLGYLIGLFDGYRARCKTATDEQRVLAAAQTIEGMGTMKRKEE